jgi:alpha-L-rhamnosidase
VTVRGQVACTWSRTERTVRVEVTVPFGSAAEVVIPKLGIRNIVVREGGTTIWAKDLYVAGAAGIGGAVDKDGAIRVKTGGGRYVFVLEGD